MVSPTKRKLRQFERMEVNEMNKCLSFTFRGREKTAVFYKKTSLLLVQAALDHHPVKSPSHNNKIHF